MNHTEAAKLIDGRPALYLSNFSSARSKSGRHGPGLVYTIMVAPRRWEHGEGKVLPLMHDPEVFFAANRGEITFDELRHRFEAKLTEGAALLAPGKLAATTRPEQRRCGAKSQALIEPGDTLCCGCAAGNPCHRRWAAPYLHQAGWAVVLDGELWRPA